MSDLLKNKNAILVCKHKHHTTMAQHNQLGKIGEQHAVDFLERKGYRILDQNWRAGHKEIDIVALHDGKVVFIEVKTRSTDVFGNPEEFVDDKKIKRILSAADTYMKMHRFSARVRFDIISVLIQYDKIDIRHIEDAFDILPE